MNIIDSVVSAVFPEAGLRRARARLALSAVRDYDAATKGRRGASLRGRGTGANTEIGPALGTLRDRARDLCRNTPHGPRMLDVLVAHAVGTGISVVWDTGSDRQDRIVRSAWEEWSRRADIRGGDFAGLQALALRSTIEGGDCLVRMIDRRVGDGRRVPFALQGLEGDHIDESRDGVGTTAERESRLGVRFAEWDVPVSYWVRPRHPGEVGAFVGFPQSVEVPATDVVHLHRRLRFGQVRGVTWLAPILMTSRDYADLWEAIIVKAKIEACFSAFVTSPDGAAASPLDKGSTGAPGERIERLRPGAVTYLRPGEEISFATPTGTSQFEQVSISALQAMAVGVGLTYDQVTGDLRQANYSSLRAGKIEQRRLVEQIQWLMLAPQLMYPIIDRFLDRALLAGVLPSRRQGYSRSLVMPRVEPIDPKKDLEADILAVRAGLMTPQDFTAGWGVDWRDNLDAFAQWFAAVDEGRMIFDIDPRRSTQSGAVVQPASDQGQST